MDELDREKRASQADRKTAEKREKLENEAVEFENIEEEFLQDWQEAEKSWRSCHYPFRGLDQRVRPFLNLPAHGSWARNARQALFLSPSFVAARLGLSRSAYLKLERNEGRLRIDQLKQIAEAMECELVYAIRPKERMGFSQRVADTLSSALKQSRFRIFPSTFSVNPRAASRMRVARFCSVMTQLMYDPQFRKAHGWTKNDGAEFKEMAQLLHAMRRLER